MSRENIISDSNYKSLYANNGYVVEMNGKNYTIDIYGKDNIVIESDDKDFLSEGSPSAFYKEAEEALKILSKKNKNVKKIHSKISDNFEDYYIKVEVFIDKNNYCFKRSCYQHLNKDEEWTEDEILILNTEDATTFYNTLMTEIENVYE